MYAFDAADYSKNAALIVIQNTSLQDLTNTPKAHDPSSKLPPYCKVVVPFHQFLSSFQGTEPCTAVKHNAVSEAIREGFVRN